MSPPDVLLDAQRLIGRLWREKQSPERARILECAGYTLSFISASGLDYRFEDFRHSSNRPSQAEQGSSDTANLRELLTRTQGFFNQLRAEPESSHEQGPLRIVLDALDYVVSTGELEALGEHIRRVEAGTPPRVVAAFASWGEATAWLEQAPEPPSRALVLIDGQYHQALYLRGINHRKVIPWPAMEYYLAELVQDVAPVAMATFASRELAEAWLKTQTAPPDRAWVLIASEFHLAVNHANVQCRVLYPLSMAAGYTVNDEVEPEQPPRE
jgi:hypothetical protein